MKLKKLVPIVTTDRINEVKEFYTSYFNFKVCFEMEDKHLSIVSGKDPEFEISFMAPENDQQPTFAGHGLTYCLEVNDVDSEFLRLSNEGLEIVQQVQDNPWGDRSFILLDPAGVAIYIFHLISPTEEFKQYFKTAHETS
ncbi:VOC family protein [bacterium]|nr:VOC family protein [bacterium]